MSTLFKAIHGDDYPGDEELFARIANNIHQQGYSINPAALPGALADALLQQVQGTAEEKFSRAGIGRGQDFVQSRFVRTDEICWITGDSEAPVSKPRVLSSCFM